MQKYNLNRYGFSIVLPDDWELEQEKNVFTCYNPTEGVGALQISVYYSELKNSIDPRKELIDYLTERNILDDEIIESIESTSSKSSVSYVEEDDYWEVTIMVKRDKIFFITYNCEMQDQLEEQVEVEQILKSIK